VIVVERVGPFEAIKRSVEILRKSWGEALIGTWGLGLFNFLLFIPAIILIAIGVSALNTAPPIGFTILAAPVLYILLWAAVCSAMHGIYVSALYQFAITGRVPAGFEQTSMSGAFRQAQRTSWF